ncbi:signal peptidase I [Paremcibacter congregatus]|uniref:Signal peptidase I n=1 Tax=Paremcibacter congregatus TaxID=2043170 RepID=A0A2G4YND5_9PROT|nr:signal peptidase I [Paremcibacter congregatus]PHZ83805.1 signal peptidase I [Paremcibacter congregatus]QDE27508.1 signal peptidase I [Paremcibacter congregatus]
MSDIKSEDVVSKAVEKEKKEEGWLSVLIWALVIAMIFRSFFFQPFKIPSKSMMDNLLVGDYLLVSKMSYGYSHHSLPWSPEIFSGRIFSSPVERGDVVVFRLPRDPDIYYIKRIVGLPGDTIQMKKSRLYLNGKIVPRERVGDFKVINEMGREETYPKYKETLPSGRSYMTLDERWNVGGYGDDTPVFKVPEGHYFAMGDNRDNSQDSRWKRSEGVGYVPEENIVGRAEVIWISFDDNAKLWEFWKWFPEQRRERIFTGIK